MRIATPSPNRRASPRHPDASWWSANSTCTAGRPRRVADAVHHVVVDQRERVQELEGGTGVERSADRLRHRRRRRTPSGRTRDAAACPRRARTLGGCATARSRCHRARPTVRSPHRASFGGDVRPVRRRARGSPAPARCVSEQSSGPKRRTFALLATVRAHGVTCSGAAPPNPIDARLAGAHSAVRS